jgi:four helix bundle protein
LREACVGLESYRDLKVWQKGMEIAERYYVLTRTFPKSELYGLTSQINRSAAGIPANIAEGYGRASRKEYVQFVRIANGSLKELETHLILGYRVGIADKDEAEEVLLLCEEEGRMLLNLIRSLEGAVP